MHLIQINQSIKSKTVEFAIICNYTICFSIQRDNQVWWIFLLCTVGFCLQDVRSNTQPVDILSDKRMSQTPPPSQRAQYYRALQETWPGAHCSSETANHTNHYRRIRRAVYISPYFSSAVTQDITPVWSWWDDVFCFKVAAVWRSTF